MNGERQGPDARRRVPLPDRPRLRSVRRPALMSEVVNLTPFAAVCLPSMGRDGDPRVLLVIAASYRMPGHGQHELQSLEEPPEVRLADAYVSDPECSSLRHEGQSAYTRPGTDVSLVGHAWAPGGKPVARSTVGLRVGALTKGAVVFGDRVWQERLGLRPGAARSFTRLPLVYERCFGGSPERGGRSTAAATDRNPVGMGLFASERDALGRPLPNFENPGQLLATANDRPAPWGFGPIARHWQPRRSYAGTYDERWEALRLPLWPKDLDERFFHAAPQDLRASPYLQGGEPVTIAGMSPDGPLTFELPRNDLRVRADLQGGHSTHTRPVLDCVEFDCDAMLLTQVYRASFPVDPLTVRAVVIRPHESWESP